MATSDFFRARFETMIDLRHPLAVLILRMPSASIESSLAPLFTCKPGKGELRSDADLFGQSVQLAGQYLRKWQPPAGGNCIQARPNPRSTQLNIAGLTLYAVLGTTFSCD